MRTYNGYQNGGALRMWMAGQMTTAEMGVMGEVNAPWPPHGRAQDPPLQRGSKLLCLREFLH